MSQNSEALAAVRRAGQAFSAQVAEQVILPGGVAFVSPQYPEYCHGSQMREVVIPPGRDMASLFSEVEAFYAARGLACHKWTPAAVQPVEPVEAFLLGRGYTPVVNLAMWLERDVSISVNPRVRLLPARAMPRAFRAVVRSNPGYPPPMLDTIVQVAVDRLNDPQYDMYVALVDDQPAALGALLQVGDIGSIETVYVAPAFRRSGVAATLIAHLTALSRRLALRITCLETEETNLPAQALYRRCGFEPAGTFREYIAPAAIQGGLFQLSIDQ